MDRELEGMKVAFLVDEGFEQVELAQPREALDRAGADTRVVSPRDGKVRGWNHAEWGEEVGVDLPLELAKAEQFDALMLPGGVMNPDRLRMRPEAVAFVRAFHDAGKPIAAICHAPWMLIEAGAVKGRRVTSWPSLKTDLTHAGASWVDEPVVRDGPLVTSRKPGDIPQFNQAMIELFRGSRSQARAA